MVALTEKAAEKVKSYLAAEKEPAAGLRVAVVGGGCSGFSYALEVADKEQIGDTVIESNGVKLYVDTASVQYLNGVEIDYVESPTQSGFKFNNPNATKSCGCGSSFSA